MFRIECFVDDKKLAEALRGLAGVVLGDPKVAPVVNGAAKNGKVVAETSGEITDLFSKWAKDHGHRELRAEGFRDFCKAIGRPITAYNYHLSKIVEAGLLKKSGTGSGTVYKVMVR